MEDNSKLNHAIDITEIISELKELRIIVNKIKNHDCKFDQKKPLSSKEIWEENLEGIFQLKKTLIWIYSIWFILFRQFHT